ncbi:hypothetical protein HK097_002047 [Rhizophlyctis rosea]|uniref:Uncharacterized protein n=1 Tax=Rhizophlyctis rosea TaxID=64517 RepID=A0AAD5WY01_9FUNG|nr:hypothetical protein HK097_002047 [Rhizophlyctis rosea]
MEKLCDMENDDGLLFSKIVLELEQLMEVIHANPDKILAESMNARKEHLSHSHPQV